MGQYVKVYLNEQRETALKAWKAQRQQVSEEGVVVSTSGLILESLDNQLVEEGVLADLPYGLKLPGKEQPTKLQLNLKYGV